MHLTSTISISLVLFLIGLTCLLLLTAHDIGVNVKENIKLSILLDDSIEPDYTKRIERYLQAAPYTKSVEYISKDEALKELVATLGEASSDSINLIETKLKTFDYINQVAYQRDMANLVNDNVRRISAVLLGVAIVLLFISIALINNTIRLATYSNRFIINTMKLVGATPWFIRKPYIRRSIRNGVIAALLAIGYLAAMFYYAQHRWGFDLSIPPHTWGAVCAVIMLTGMAITGASAYLSVGRYVKMSTNDLYFV